MKSKYTYKLRPTYGLAEMMIEFFVLDKDALILDLLKLFHVNGFTVGETEDMWLMDEVWINLHGKKGNFIISNAMYGFVFIFVTKNQHVIFEVDKILEKSELFEKEDVNFEDYRLDKKKPSSDDEKKADLDV